VGYLPALNLALSVGLRPDKVGDARTCSQGGLAQRINVLQSIAIPGAFLDAINPVVVDGTGAGVVVESHRVRVVYLFAIDHAGLV